MSDEHVDETREEQSAELAIGSVDDILAAAKFDCGEEIVAVPEWKCSVKIRTLTAADRSRIKALAAAGAMKGRVDTEAIDKLEFRLSVVEPKFDDQQVNVLHHRSSAGWQRVADAIDRINGGGEAQAIKQFQEQFQG